MKKFIALLFSIASGLYLLVGGPMPDPIPFIDEGLALAVFVSSMGALGIDLRRFVPFLKTKTPRAEGKKDAGKEGPVVDV